MYSAELLDHFEHPRHAGELPGAAYRVTIENPACGDILELAANVEQGYLRELRFRAKGCVPAMACASVVTELASGKSLADAASISRADIVEVVKELPPTSGHAAQLAWEALQALLRAAQ